MAENIQNSFEWYMSLFTFYIIPLNYATFMDQTLIFEPKWVQNVIIPKKMKKKYLKTNKKKI